MGKIIKFFKEALWNQRGNVGFMGGQSSGEGGDPSGASGSDSSGTASAEGGDPQSQPQGQQQQAPQSSQGFTLDSLGEEYRDHKSLQNFIQDNQVNVGELVKSYVNAQKLIGSDKMMVPNENFTEEQWNETYKKLGLPETFENYKVEPKKVEDFQMNEEFVDGVKKAAFESGILPKQAQQLMDFMTDYVANDVKSAQEKRVEPLQQGVESLKKEWGQGYEKELHIAEQGINHFADQEEIEKLRESGVIDNPEVVKLFNKIGKALNSEDSFSDEGKKGFGMSPDEIKQEIESMYQPGHPFMVKTHPENKNAVQKMLKLQEMLHGNGEAKAFAIQA